MVLKQKLTVENATAAAGAETLSAHRRGWEHAARENLGMEEWVRAGAAPGRMSHPAEAGREDLSPICRRVLVRGDLVPFGPQVLQQG